MDKLYDISINFVDGSYKTYRGVRCYLEPNYIRVIDSKKINTTRLFMYGNIISIVMTESKKGD